jgi:hypothetical protein
MRPSRVFLIVYYIRSRAVNTLGMTGMVSLGGSTGDALFARIAGPGIIKIVITRVLK